MKIIFIMMLTLTLSACSLFNNTKPNTQVDITTSMQFPQLPNIDIPPQPNLSKWSHDVPRDTSQDMIVKKLTKCLNVPEEKRTVDNNEFWAECGEYPVLTNAQEGVMFDQHNYDIILQNFAKLKLDNYHLRKLLDEINSQRSTWRARNANAELDKITQ